MDGKAQHIGMGIVQNTHIGAASDTTLANLRTDIVVGLHKGNRSGGFTATGTDDVVFGTQVREGKAGAPGHFVDHSHV